MMLNSGVNSVKYINEYRFVQSLKKTVQTVCGVHLESDTVSDLLIEIAENNRIHLSMPSNIYKDIQIVFEDLKPVTSFSVHAAKGDYEKSKMFELLDSYDDSNNGVFLLYDSMLPPGDNIFIIANNLRLKGYVNTHKHCYVASLSQTLNSKQLMVMNKRRLRKTYKDMQNEYISPEDIVLDSLHITRQILSLKSFF